MARESGPLRRSTPAWVAWTLAAACGLGLAAPARATPVPVTVTITSVGCTQDDECDEAGIEALGESTPDFYAKIFINNVETVTAREPDDRLYVEPKGWTATTVVDDAVTPLVPVAIQIWDHDGTSGDDLGDASPQADHNNLDLVVNLARSGAWSGDTTTACATGDGVDTDDTEYYPMKVCFDITVGADQDGDGLTDAWETSGFDADGDGTIDVNLPAMGASPTRQDVFVELDYEAGRAPTRDGIAAMKRAFALAPRANPDGSSGITLHVDVGRLVDPLADEAGSTGTCSNGLDDDGDGTVDGADASCRLLDANREVVAGNCGNGVDDDGDGQVDGNDPNCRVGDDFGGGGTVPTVGACGLDNVFVAAKAANFNPARARIFHYGLVAAAPSPPPPSAGPLGCQGGQGELGGNDFISHNRGPGTLMHELGHNLNLDHGGTDPGNCKPNYLSVMNYNLQSGIPRVGGGTILDYSPPRQALDGSTRSFAPLASLTENALDENNPIDPGDPRNQTIFLDALNRLITVPLGANPNYNGDVPDPPRESGLTVNLDNGIPPTATTPGVGARGCANAATNSTLAGANDWNRVALAFRQFAAAASGAVVPMAEEVSPTDEELDRIEDAIHRTDLAVALAATPDPVPAGTDVTYVATVTNAGPNPAAAAALTLTLPPETSRTGALPPACAEPAPGTVACALGNLLAGATRTVTVAAAVPPSLVHDAGAPLVITAQAAVQDRAGTDPNPADNAASRAVTAVAVADLAVTGLTVDNPPVQMRTNENVVIALSSIVTSSGPSSPMDTHLTLTASADAGAAVSPTWLKTAQPALRDGEQRPVANHAIISCRTRGPHRFDLAQRIAPARTPDSDPNAGNDEARTRLVVECLGADEVVVNLQPGQWPNEVRLGTREASIAILTTAAGEYGRAAAFDAADIVVESVRIGSRRMLDGLEPGTDRFGGTALDDSIETTLPETTQDGDKDLTLFYFDVDASGLRATDREVCAKGRYRDPASGAAQEFFGCDAAVILP